MRVNSKVNPISIIESLLSENGLKHEKSYKFSHKKEWCMDIAVPSLRLGIEIDYPYNTKKYDNNKYNTANILGWTVLRYTVDVVQKSPQQIVKDIQFIKGRGRV